jgi:hypothetical protein
VRREKKQSEQKISSICTVSFSFLSPYNVETWTKTSTRKYAFLYIYLYYLAEGNKNKIQIILNLRKINRMIYWLTELMLGNRGIECSQD